ncbi:MAG: single-stranded DNA-binding protein [Candidatus Marinimicrobia bacterium]|nr:single-stranded DNA-binding protein [Candidatus Neomarinimicrobiota bacterium]MBL7108729.1 single-stranded DNA-binding protein [Candidatus Neomarinimicrobiota bacterium]
MQRSSVNKVQLVGRIGNKPEGRFTPSGSSTASFSLATNETWVNADNQKQEHTEWHNLTAWNKSADFVTKYIQKGQLVYIEGRLRTRSWKDKDDNPRKTTEIICDTITPLEWKGESSEEKPTTVSEPGAEKGEEDLPF